jgi:hypothetical protein
MRALDRRRLVAAAALLFGIATVASATHEAPTCETRTPDRRVCEARRSNVNTLEDAYGETGEFFRAAVGFRNREPAPGAPEADPGYGLGIDDMVVEWREFTLVEDATDCTPAGPGVGGECAVLGVETSAFFQGSALMTVTVLESSPSPNDCDLDGTPDSPDDFDCDDDGTPDVVVRAQSPLSDPAGEPVIANRTSDPCDCQFVGNLAVSHAYDAAGVLFLQQVGTAPSTVELTYVDRDDGTGEPCRNSPRPELQGLVRASVEVLTTSGNVKVTQTILTDGQNGTTFGDGDGFADTHETVELRIGVTNSTGVALENVVARLSTNDPKIECILVPEAFVGDIPAVDQADPSRDPEVLAETAFRFKVGPDSRTGVCRTADGAGSQAVCELDADCGVAGEFCSAPFELFSAELTVTFSSTGATAIASSAVPQVVTLDLDLDAAGGGAPTTFTEDFETGSDFGSFVTDNIDTNLGSNIAADGYRCQYTNPDWPNSNIYGWADEEFACYPGPTGPNGNEARARYWWSINSADPNNPSLDGGRAYSGTGSLYFGYIDPDLPAEDNNTTPTGMLEGIRSGAPIDLAWESVCRFTRDVQCGSDADCEPADTGAVCAGGTCSNSGAPCGDVAECVELCVQPSPTLTFKHQVSLMDNPPHGCAGPVQGAGRAMDRAVLQVQFAGADDPGPDDAPSLSPWIKVAASQFVRNGYEIQAVDNFIACMFDPVDDGNDEDDWFDPTDPDRRLGPSSTCFPEFVWAASGDTDGDSGDVDDFWRADGPGLVGAVGKGTWVESVVDLSRFRGRRLRLRFLESGINGGHNTTWEQAFSPLNPDDCDDGWWIDDIHVTDAIDAPATVTADTASNEGLPGCGTDCDAVVAAVEATPVADATTPLPAPGLALELDAGGSHPDPKCVDGILQYRFWIDGSGNGLGGDAADTLLRDFSDDPILPQAPGAGTTTYVVEVRCSSAPGCVDSVARDVVVDCPTSGARGGASTIFQTIVAVDANTLSWAEPEEVVFAEGDLAGVSSYTTTATGTSSGAVSTHPMGSAEWYLLRSTGGVGGEFCNSAGGPGSWASGGAGESGTPGRDSVLP